MQKGEKKEETPEREPNPFTKFISNTILKPIDATLEGVLKMVENAGLVKQVQLPYYQAQDYFWWPIAHQLFDFTITGQENVPPDGVPAVFCMNHQSMFDPFLFGLAITHHTGRIGGPGRPLHIMAKVELFKIPLVNSYLRWIYAFPVNRGEHDEVAYQKALDLLAQGEIVGMFPEGTLNGGGLNLLEPKIGTARLAIDAKVPLVPIGLSGSEKVLPKGQKYPNFNAKLTARIGKPITMHEQYFGKKATNEELMEIMNHVMDKIRGLLLY
jgi:1-acyl-sn-glycerol-3-phosphate acyltransferase